MDLSILILSYNTKDITHKCISILISSLRQCKNYNVEIIVLDNASHDGSKQMLTKLEKKCKARNNNIGFTLIKNISNVGFSKGNNIAFKKARGRYVLYLNSDAYVNNVDFSALVNYLDIHTQVGGLTVKLVFENGRIDPASHRGFPTVWRSFCYYAKLETAFGSVPFINRLFGGYHMTWCQMNKTHDIESPSGAFFMVRKDIIKNLKGFDEDYFMYGEDLDLAFRIKQLGYRIEYHPQYEVLHLKYSSGLTRSDPDIRKKTHEAFYSAMKIFYSKHYAPQHPHIMKLCILKGIDTIKLIKSIKQ